MEPLLRAQLQDSEGRQVLVVSRLLAPEWLGSTAAWAGSLRSHNKRQKKLALDARHVAEMHQQLCDGRASEAVRGVLFSDDILAFHGIHGSLAQLLDASGQQWEQLTIQGLWRALNNGFVVETGHQLEEIDRALRLVSSAKLQKAYHLKLWVQPGTAAIKTPFRAQSTDTITMVDGSLNAWWSVYRRKEAELFACYCRTLYMPGSEGGKLADCGAHAYANQGCVTMKARAGSEKLTRTSTPARCLASQTLLSNTPKQFNTRPKLLTSPTTLAATRDPISDMDSQTGAGATADKTSDFDHMSVHELKSWLTNHGVDLTGEDAPVEKEDLIDLCKGHHLKASLGHSHGTPGNH